MAANINPETGISYGVISLNSLEDWVYEEFLNHGRNLSYDAALAEFKSTCDHEEGSDEYEVELQNWNDHYCGEEEEHELETEGMKLGLSYLGGAAHVWVFESPHTTNCRYCSPCCPNAGNLDSKEEGGACRAYDLPTDWYRSL